MNELQKRFASEIEQLQQVAVAVGDSGLVTSQGGNLSYRVSEEHVLITPTKLAKSSLNFDDIVIIDLGGRVDFAASGRRPTGETPMHLNIYRRRPDLQSLIHAHPSALTGIALTDSDILARPLLPEPVIELGPILEVEYAEPVSRALAAAFDAVIDYSNAWLMRNHGITVGSPEGPRRTLELLQMAEAMAKSVGVAGRVGGIREISREEVRRLERVVSERGLPRPGNPEVVKTLEELYYRITR